MANEYLVLVHNYISGKIAVAKEGKETARKQGDYETQRFYSGQLEELYNMREYLSARIDLKTQRYY